MKALLTRSWLLLVPVTAWAVGFAPDQRHLAPTRPPFTALARTHAHRGVGCGVLVGPDLLLTCAHCISNPRREVYDDVEIELGLGFEPVSRRARLKNAILQPDGSTTIAAGQDWAIVQLDRPLGAYYGWLDCRYLSDSEWADQEIELLGYCGCPDEARPQFGRMDQPYRCTGSVSHVGPEIVFHNFAMWGGTSGAPLLAKLGDTYSLVGLNFAGVDIEGETLEHGFRQTYKKEWANLAIPARNWQSALQALPRPPAPVLKSVWIRNASNRAVSVKTRYHSVFSAPEDPPVAAQVRVAAGAREALLTRQEGCCDEELSFSVSPGKSVVQRLKGAETTVLIR